MKTVMSSTEIRRRFLAFFEKRGHTIIPSASLVTPDEKGVTNSTLFNTAGMQPLIPYLLGEPHPSGKRLVDVQKCIRTVDIDDVGDRTHNTFFEMLGNWSLGDYFKKEAIEWSFELLTNKDDGFGLDPNRLYVTVFEGDTVAPRDEEAAAIWQGIFKKNGIDFGGDTSKGSSGRIFYMPAKNNWWEAGDNGPCGPDTEMFYDVSNAFSGRTLAHQEYVKADDERHVVEIWNDVFMQYVKKDGKIIGNLPKPSVDTGAGLERIAMTLQGVDNIYDTDLFKSAIEKIKEISGKWNLKSARIVADHIRASAFLIAAGVTPSNTGRGYILRRLIRRASKYARHDLEVKEGFGTLIDIFVASYKGIYPEIPANRDLIVAEIQHEDMRFTETLDKGYLEMHKVYKSKNLISGEDAFVLFTSYGFPFELLMEMIKDENLEASPNIQNVFSKMATEHQSLSRAGAEQKFKGGLADANDPMVVRYHTATHLLHQALHDVLGDGVGQKGSNITRERLRFDFSHGAKMTDDEKRQVEAIVNEKIAAKLPVTQIIMPRAQAEQTGARHFFGEKYGDQISIYYVGPASNPPSSADLATAYSKEFCGGPHVANTSDLAGPEGKLHFRIQKEEAVSQGVRRIKAVLE